MGATAALKFPFNAAQLELLQVMAGGLTDEQLKELKQTLLEFKFKQATIMADKLLDAKGIFDSETLEREAQKMKRSPYMAKKNATTHQPVLSFITTYFFALTPFFTKQNALKIKKILSAFLFYLNLS